VPNNSFFYRSDLCELVLANELKYWKHHLLLDHRATPM
jgi:hypothetical protein